MLSNLIFVLAVSLSLTVSLSNCSSNRTTTKTQEPVKDYAALNYQKGTVKDIELDGCRFIIDLENGKRIQPENLEDIMKKDGLAVWVKYEITDRPNICMSGVTAMITAIELRK